MKLRHRSGGALAAWFALSLSSFRAFAQQAPALEPAAPAAQPSEPVPAAQPSEPAAAAPAASAPAEAPSVAASAAATTSAPAAIEPVSPAEPPPQALPAEPSWADAAATGEEGTQPSTLRTYGFMDFGFQKFWASEKSQLNFLFPSNASTFVLGNANVFFDATPYEGWHSLLEVRFTNLPHGVEQQFGTADGAQAYRREDTRTDDFTGGSLRNTQILGAIIIERAFAEYSVSDALKLKGGYFFTPYGIWNLDHGTPTLISLLLPAFQADQFIPNRQLGAEVYGSTYVSEWELGYHAYVGNSRTPSQVDFTDDKSFGGRVFAGSIGSAVQKKLGISGYVGTGSNIERTIVSVDPYVLESTETVAYDEWALGADASLDVGKLRLRSEAMVQRRDYASGKRGNMDPDSYRWDAYALAAYQLPWWGLEPYAYLEFMHYPSTRGDSAWIPSVGLNVHFNPAVQLKAQYARALFFDYVTESDRNPADNDAQNLAIRLVVSF
jgi:hypothetical protein